VWCAKNKGKGGKLFIGVVNVRQGCVEIDVSRTTIQTPASNPVASIAHMQHAHVIW
jgi:hypothetical protein